MKKSKPSKKDINLCVVLVPVMLVAFGCLLAGCGSESKGVPDEIVYQEIGDEYEELSAIADSAVYVIGHNVDKTTHTDTVQVELIGKTKYGKETDLLTLQYQYNKSSGLWTLVGESRWSCLFDANEEGFLGCWARMEQYSELYLDIYEFQNGMVRVSFEDIKNAKYYAENEYVTIGEYTDIAAWHLDRNVTSYPILLSISGISVSGTKMTKIG